MHTILGAGGAIGNLLTKELNLSGIQVRLVGRNPKPIDGATEVVSADVSDRESTINAVTGSSVVYLLVGLKYDVNVWRELWPRIMENTIEACKQANARLIFFDNVYAYGKVSGAMTEATPFNPCSKKGEIRAKIATTLLDAMKAGQLTATIARAADFYGPGAQSGVPNILIFDKFAKGDAAACLVDASFRHSYTFTPDAARSLVQLAGSEASSNQTWHLPTASNPPTGKEFIEMAAAEFCVPPRFRVLGSTIIKVGGWFDGATRELVEMLYQNSADYLFDATKFAIDFDCAATTYADGIRETTSAYKRQS